MSKALCFVVLFLLASGAACMAQSDQTSLGDLARKQRDEKKPVKTFTNEDVATTHPQEPAGNPAGSASASSSSAVADASAKADAKKDTNKSEPTTAASKDAPEVAELKNKISSYKQEQDGWKRAAKRYQDLLANETSEFRRQMYQDALDGDQNNIQIYQEKIDQAQADLAKAEKPH
jgi:hypothetical protein